MNRQSHPVSEGTSKGRPGATLVVGLGASAGGLEPLQEFLQHVPAASGLVFVVIQHLEPNHPSMLAELLARHTAMPVLQASDGLAPEPDHVYVIAPGTLLTIDKGVLRVVASESPSSSLIDAFFRSLAEDQGEHAVGVLFSGAGHDGSVGLRAIKEHGGLTLAQPPETATHDSMLQSAIGAGLADHVVLVAQMPAIIAEHAEHLTKFDAAENLDEQLAAHLGKICALIHQRTGHDFSRYKEGTLLRRIRRRLQVHRLESVQGYLQLLENDSAEAAGLLKDLLIGVTQFFRDPEAFNTLAQEIIPRIVQGKSADAPIRIWVPGCASGEEAYSIAILLREHLERIEARHFVQIFATDLDAAMLGEARHGRYPADIADQVSPERLARFFVRDTSTGSGRAADFQAVKELREMCIFSEHSLIRDPPFSQLDLISCRNVLIYLSAELQKKLVPLFHYALRPGGFLFLGPSEGISGSPELFEPADKRNRIFRRKETVNRPAVEFPLASRSAARVAGASPPQGMFERRAQTPHEKIGAAFERTILEEYAAPSAVINQRGDVLFVAGPLSRHLQLPAGALTNTNLLEAFRGNLRQELRMALRTAGEKRRKIVRKNISVESEDSTRRVHLTVRPMPAVEPEAGLFLVALQEMEPPEESGPGEVFASEAAEPAVEQLENELRTARAELKTTVEELESANEEMKSSNEELISTNEELQSANEEMQTSKEEQQSLNEELETVNTELRQKVDELGAANSDLQNLFAATEIATIFLDRSLRVARFTPAATALFHLIETDVGRPLADFAQRFAGQDLTTDAQEVLRVLTPIERQVRSAEGAWFVLRVVPYRTVENLIAGVVVTFVDVTELKHAEDEVKRQGQLVHLSHDAILIWRLDGGIESWNRGAQELYGFSRDEAFGRVSQQLLQSTFPLPWPEIKAELLSGGCWAGDVQQRTKDGRAVIVSSNFQLVLGEDGAARVLEANRDISERKGAEQALRESEARLSFSLNAARTGAWDLDLVDHTAQRSLQHDQIFGYQELLPRWTYEMFIEHVLPEDREAVDRNFRQAIATRGDWSFECRILRHDGATRWIWAAGRHRADETGQPRRMAGIVQDITERKQAEAALRESHDRTSAILESIADSFYSLDDQWRFVVVNPAAERAPFGRPASELIGKVIWDVFPSIPGTPIHQHYLDAVAKRNHEHYEAQSPLNRRWYEVFMFPRTGGLDVYMRDITDRKRAEEALRESEARLKLAQQIAHLGSWELDLVENRLSWSDEVFRIFGLEPQAFGATYEAFLDAIHPEDRAAVDAAYSGSLRDGRDSYEIEHRVVRKGSGEVRFVHEKCEHTRGASGRIIRSVGMVQDITERRRAEEELREREQRLRLATTAANLGVFEWNVPSDVARWDDRMFEIFGRTRAEGPIGRDAFYAEALEPDDRLMFDRALAEAARPDALLRVACRIRRRCDNQQRWIQYAARFDLAPDGSPERMIGVLEDITERKNAESALQIATQRFYAVLSTMYSGVLLVTSEGRVEFANQAFCDCFGLDDTPTGLAGLGAGDIIAKIRDSYAHPDEAIPRIQEIVDRGTPVKGEEVAMRGGATLLRDFVPLGLGGASLGRLWLHIDISERKRAEEALRDSERLLTDIIDGSPMPIFLKDLDGRFLTVNKRLEGLLGMTREQLKGKTDYDTISRDNADVYREHDRQVIQSRHALAIEETAELADGHHVFLNSKFPLVDSAGRVYGVGAISHDITDRKRAEEALSQSHKTFSELIERAPFGIYVVDSQFRVAHMNTSSQTGAFRNVRPIIGRDFSEAMHILWPEPVAAEIIGHFRHTLETGEPFYSPPFFNPRHDVEAVEGYEWELHRMMLPDGQFGVICYYFDSTKMRQAEAALRESEARFRHLADAMPQLVWTAEPDGTVDYLNRRHEKLSGARRGDDGTWTWSPVIHPDDLQATLAAWDHAVRTGQNYEREQRLLLADGAFRWHLARATPIRDESGRIVKWYGTTTDIHPMKEAQQALQEADQHKNEFLAVLSHELRNPLTPIRNSLYILERVTPGGDQAKRALEVIGRQSGQLTRLVDDLLDVTRISRNKIQLQHGPLDLNELVRRTVEDHHSLFEGKGIAVETAWAEQRLPMSGDAARLAQMVGNLLQNAAKFTPAGGRVAVSTAVAPSRARAILRISDNGVGIEPAMLTRLFQPFMQAEATLDRSKGGLGLGLALVKGLVEMHGGDVRAHSDGPGKGAEFVVELPLETTFAGEASPREVGAKQIRRRVLIIEDNIDAADSLREVLAFGDHVVEVAYNGPDGLARAREFKPEVVLCDIGLPGMDGFEVARAFRADDALKGIFLVALSGYALPEDLQRAHEAGFDRHLAKPPIPEKIEQVLASAHTEESRGRS